MNHPPPPRATAPRLAAIEPPKTEHIARLRNALEPLHRRLEHHAVFSKLTSAESLRIFSEIHVFAVWDFMSLIKSLQGSLTGHSVPWVPSRDPEATRLVNAIVLSEECERRQDGNGYVSHFQLYCEGMRLFGANTDVVDEFVRLLQDGERWQRALSNANVPEACARFIRYTMRVSEMFEPHQVAASFLFGREAVLSSRFQGILESLKKEQGVDTTGLLFYLDRHMEVNRHQHATASERLVAVLCGQDEDRWAQAEKTARESLEERILLWDAVVRAIDEHV